MQIVRVWNQFFLRVKKFDERERESFLRSRDGDLNDGNFKLKSLDFS